MADQKKLKKKALKAYDKAEDAVADARKAVDEARRRAKELTKKSRPKVSPLEDALDTAAAGLGGAKKELKKAKQASEAPSTSGKGSSASANDSASAGDSSSTSSATPAEQRSIYTPPLPEVDETTVQTADGHDAHVDLHAQTLVALRALARTKGVTNVSRYTKAALIEKIEQA
ncbi:putative phage infection (PIP) family protein YhgE [Frigoribacterium sp. PvP054]|uniref:Rho termination factor N-terminal domain-containing protein n=1 Tax=Frigoribacterium sp. PvP054 TaxID=3156438 RepID=UPI003399F7E9